MDWRKNKVVGIVAAVLAVLAIALFVHNISQSDGDATVYICESTGKTFNVDMSPDNPDIAEYLVPADQGVPCKYDDLNDAYLAVKDAATGEWGRVMDLELIPPED